MMTHNLKEAIRRRAYTLGYDRYFDDILLMVDDLIDSSILFLDEDLEKLRLRYEESAEELEANDQIIADLRKEIQELETVIADLPDYGDGYAAGYKAGRDFEANCSDQSKTENQQGT